MINSSNFYIKRMVQNEEKNKYANDIRWFWRQS